MSSEKRFVVFMAAAVLVLVGSMAVQNFLLPRPPVAENGLGDDPEVAQADEEGQPAEGGLEQPAAEKADDPETTELPATPNPPDSPDPQTGVAGPQLVADADQDLPRFPSRRVALGSMAADSPYRLLVILNSRGAAIEQVELVERNAKGIFRYRELFERGGYVYDRRGYLGYLALAPNLAGEGCLVNVVPPGSPAATATAAGAAAGLQVGDVILSLDGQPVANPEELAGYLRKTKPEQSVELLIRRAGVVEDLTYQCTLDSYPLAAIRPEDPEQLSCLLTLADAKAIRNQRSQIPVAQSLLKNNWMYDQEESARLSRETGDPAVVFRYPLSGGELAEIGQTGSWEIVKRYQLAAVISDQALNPDYPGYHLKFSIEVRNTGQESASLALQLDGPNGLPNEGWWYSNKIHPSKFSGAGARDVVWKTADEGYQLLGCPTIYKWAKKNPETPNNILIDRSSDQTIEYAGVDTQYFASVFLAESDPKSPFRLTELLATPLSKIDDATKYEVRKTNISFRLLTAPRIIAAGGKYEQNFTIFTGPKRPDLLQEYNLKPLIAYGWFKWVAIPLSGIMHFFFAIVKNYGLAIILLTVLVRACMFPISRKAAKNAQMMQALAPELKKLSEKYKNDMEKRSQAQRELFAKNNYNPFGGCLLMFLQLPIFIGLYRSLAVDIQLRDASLIPGIQWCSNLAGPDMFWYWETYLPAFFASPATGWLGPYLNILPLVTIALFMVHQKLFMPPPTDEQSKMQQQMMKYMMIFMGVMFFKVPAGLCIYFVASSLWGIAERKLLPSPTSQAGAEPQQKPVKKNATDASKGASGASNSSNGSGKAKQRRRSKGRR